MDTASPLTLRSTRLLPAELLVGTGIVMCVAFAASVVFGPNGLAWWQLRPEWPVVGHSAWTMGIETTFTKDAGVTMADAPRWENGSDGARDVATGGPPVEITGPFKGQVVLMGPTAATRWAWVAWRVAEPLLTVASLLVVLRIVRSVRTGNPFTAANVRRLHLLAGLVAVGGTAVSLVGSLVRQWLLDTSAAADIVARGWGVSFVPLLAGVLIAVVAAVWRAGVVMTDDLDGVV